MTEEEEIEYLLGALLEIYEEARNWYYEEYIEAEERAERTATDVMKIARDAYKKISGGDLGTEIGL